jgi:hypothetical protein
MSFFVYLCAMKKRLLVLFLSIPVLALAQKDPFFKDMSETDRTFSTFRSKLNLSLDKQDSVMLAGLLADTISNFGYEEFRMTKRQFIRSFGGMKEFYEWIEKHTRYGFKEITIADTGSTPNNGSSVQWLFADHPNQRIYSNYPFKDKTLESSFSVLVMGKKVAVRDSCSKKGKTVKKATYAVAKSCDEIPIPCDNPDEHVKCFLLCFTDGKRGYVDAKKCLTWAEYFTKIYVVQTKEGWRITAISVPSGC